MRSHHRGRKGQEVEVEAGKDTEAAWNLILVTVIVIPGFPGTFWYPGGYSGFDTLWKSLN